MNVTEREVFPCDNAQELSDVLRSIPLEYKQHPKHTHHLRHVLVDPNEAAFPCVVVVEHSNKLPYDLATETTVVVVPFAELLRQFWTAKAGTPPYAQAPKASTAKCDVV